MTPPVPVVALTSLDSVLRDAVATALALDVPGAVVVRHDLDADGWLHRSVSGLDGVLDRLSLPLDHGCLSCALRADLLPVLRLLASRELRPSAVVVALPVTTSALPLVHALGSGEVPGAVAAGVVAGASSSLALDLFGEDLLAERGLAVNAEDRRSVGEALAAQLEFADAVVLDDDVAPAVRSLLAHLVGPAPVTTAGDADVTPLLALRRTPADPRGDLTRATPTGAPDDEHVWTLDLHSPRPFHPERLRATLEDLALGPIRGRGCFWVPTRPHTPVIWDGVGGQLSVGVGGEWAGFRQTRLVVTGIGAERGRVARAFERTLLTDAEHGRGLRSWTGVDDGLDPWLGVPRSQERAG